MRQIGTLPGLDEARRFADYLLTLGVRMRLDERPDGFALWVYDEDRVALARRELEGFRAAPDDPRYRSARPSADAIRRESDRLDRQYRKNVRDLRTRWSSPNLRRRPLTVALIALSAAVFIGERWPDAPVRIDEYLTFDTLRIDPLGRPTRSGLDDIRRGQVWRLVTPIFLHGNGMHLLFNMWALSAIGTLIEYRRGTAALAVLVLVSAVASNLGEFLYLQESGRSLATFRGMSGVVYALFGYVWMKGKYEPMEGMILHPSSIQVMLFWLVLCMTGAMGPIANAAHVVGLAAGVLFGLARY